MNKRVTGKIGRCSQRRLCCRQGRAANWKHLLAHQRRRDQTGVFPTAKADTKVHILAREVYQAFGHVEPQIYAGVKGSEMLKARHQPLGCERGGDGNSHHPSRGACTKAMRD